jgi:sugar-phosphatase
MTAATFDVEAVLFDMDGTIVDSRAIVERMWLLWAAQHNLDPKPILAVAHGRRTLETMQLVAPELATLDEAARLDALEEQQEGGETAVPGAADLLAALPPDRWAVVTSAPYHLARRRIGSVGLPLPGVLVGAYEVKMGKPDPEGYVLAARHLGVEVSRTVVFEDTPAGVAAGRAAGARVIGLTTTHRTLDHCDALVADLRGIRIDHGDDRIVRLTVPV